LYRSVNENIQFKPYCTNTLIYVGIFIRKHPVINARNEIRLQKEKLLIVWLVIEQTCSNSSVTIYNTIELSWHFRSRNICTINSHMCPGEYCITTRYYFIYVPMNTMVMHYILLTVTMLYLFRSIFPGYSLCW